MCFVKLHLPVRRTLYNTSTTWLDYDLSILSGDKEGTSVHDALRIP